VRSASRGWSPPKRHGPCSGISPALLGRWQRTTLEQAVPSSAEREETKRLRAEFKRVEIERGILKKAVTSCLL